MEFVKLYTVVLKDLNIK